tara:strand:+ start:170 stop:703 length:534 start_codon:yes stop_codon:yes gene_type:complete
MSEIRNLTDYELKNLLLQAGWEENADAYSIGDIVRLIKAESSGNPRATNFKYPDYSFGLMQVNMLDEPGYLLGDERRKRYNLPNNEALFDPLTNLKVAKGIYERKGNLGDWGAWTSGAYKDYDYNPQPPLEERAAEAVNLSENWLQRLNPFRKKEEPFPGPLPPISDNIRSYGGNYE